MIASLVLPVVEEELLFGSSGEKPLFGTGEEKLFGVNEEERGTVANEEETFGAV